MSLIQANHLQFTYDGSYDPVFQDVSFRIDTGWRLGLVGRNGRGKSTLLRLLSGELDSGGALTVPTPCAVFPSAAPEPEAFTLDALENLCPGVPQWRLLRELGLLEVPEEALWRPFGTLSGGEQTRALLAALFLNESAYPLLDEPTNHLDQAGRRLLGDYLASKPGFLLVSHDRALLDRCADHMLSIERAGIQVQKGNFSTWWENRRRQEADQQTENEKLRREIVRLGESARQAGSWAGAVEKTKTGTRNSGLRPDRGYIGHKSAKMMQRAKSIQQRREAAAAEKSKLLKNVERTDALKLAQPRLPGNRLLELREVAVLYDGQPAGSPVSFTLYTGDRLVLRGPNGCGKSSLLRLICGEELAHTGTLLRSSGLRVSYVAQDSSRLRGGLRDFAREAGLDETLFLAILRKLDFPRVQFEKDLSALSGGQKKKVLLARSLCEDAHLLVWDEPLNYIDLFSRVQLEELLTGSAPTCLLAEHDERFQEQAATRIIDL